MIKKKIFVLLSLLAIQITLSAQMEGDQWVIGYWGESGTVHSIMFLDFTSGKLTIKKHTELKFRIAGTAANICDSDGEPILWTNGMQIMGRGGIIIADPIAYDTFGYWNNFYPYGFPDFEGAVILPVPQKEGEYSILYPVAGHHPVYFFGAIQYLETRVKVNQNSSFSLIYKDLPIGPNVEWFTKSISAVRHANGRDWWIIYFENDSPNYYSSILAPDGVHFDHQGSVDTIIRVGLEQTVISPKGNYMARVDGITLNEGQYITLYSFDRYTGDLKRENTFHTSTGYFTGVAFSPSERYLYADDNTHLWQWDLLAQDIAMSQTLVDTFDGFVEPGWFSTNFAPMVLAPDGRIYIVPSGGSSKRFHVIDRPDLPAPDCRFLQHNINLKIWNARSVPNLPNYRLGPIDGSSCDSLGINNLPVSRWRWEQDIPGVQSPIRFNDLSFYDPQTWHWDFDDDSTSSIPSPVHSFQPGLYHVCLTVSNEYASDSSCQWINILPTDLKEELDTTLPDIDIIPNPFKEYISITSRNETFRTASLQLYDMHGHLVFHQPEITIPLTLYLPDFAPGIYLCTIKDEDGSVRSVKLMKE